MLGSSILAPIRFGPEMEADYAAHMHERAIPLSRLASVIGGSSFVAYGFWDLLLDPEAWRTTGPIRLAIVGYFALGFAFTFLQAVRKNRTLWGLFAFSIYSVAAVGFALVLAQLEGGFVAGTSGFILGMIFIPAMVGSMTQATLLLLPTALLPLLVMTVVGAGAFALINATAWIAGGVGFAFGFAFLLDNLNRRAFELERQLDDERKRSDALLLNILPANIAERLKSGEEVIADKFESASVLFADLVGFTKMSRDMPAERLVVLLNELYTHFDRLVEKHSAEKIKTMGDAYMVATGIPGSGTGHAAAIANLALEMREAFIEFRHRHDLDLKLRIGIHSGAVVAGVIGERKFAYDLWGDTVNVASRLESQGLPDEIQISETTRALLSETYRLRSRGDIELRGHGPMPAYVLQPN